MKKLIIILIFLSFVVNRIYGDGIYTYHVNCDSISENNFDTIVINHQIIKIAILDKNDISNESRMINSATFLCPSIFDNKSIQNELIQRVRKKYNVHDIMLFKDCQTRHDFYSSYLLEETKKQLEMNTLFYSNRSKIK